MAVIALVVGSFLGAQSYRIPRRYIERWKEEEGLDELGVDITPDDELVQSKRSKCPACKKDLTWVELIPLFSFLIQGGKCRHCKARISWRYILVEMASLINGLSSYLLFGFSVEALMFFAIFSVLILASSIDIECFILPDFLTLPVAGSGVVYSIILTFTSFRLSAPFASSGIDSLLGGFLMPLFLVMFSWVFEKIRGKEGFGFGDVKLLVGIGFWFGSMGFVAALFLGSVLALFFALLKWMFKRSAVFGVYHPFGPFLVAGLYIFAIYQKFHNLG